MNLKAVPIVLALLPLTSPSALSPGFAYAQTPKPVAQAVRPLGVSRPLTASQQVSPQKLGPQKNANTSRFDFDSNLFRQYLFGRLGMENTRIALSSLTLLLEDRKYTQIFSSKVTFSFAGSPKEKAGPADISINYEERGFGINHISLGDFNNMNEFLDNYKRLVELMDSALRSDAEGAEDSSGIESGDSVAVDDMDGGDGFLPLPNQGFDPLERMIGVKRPRSALPLWSSTKGGSRAKGPYTDPRASGSRQKSQDAGFSIMERDPYHLQPLGNETPGKFYQRFWKPVVGTYTSGYGMRFHPILHYNRLHAGVDIGAPWGTPVHAALPGRVQFASWKGGYGNCIEILHGDHSVTRYGHLSAILVKPGQRVDIVSTIGRVGATGLARGNHLHFEIRHNGKPINPLPDIRNRLSAQGCKTQRGVDGRISWCCDEEVLPAYFAKMPASRCPRNLIQRRLTQACYLGGNHTQEGIRWTCGL